MKTKQIKRAEFEVIDVVPLYQTIIKGNLNLISCEYSANGNIDIVVSGEYKGLLKFYVNNLNPFGNGYWGVTSAQTTEIENHFNLHLI